MNVLVTGAGSGIGRALAVECARRGDRLFLCSRTPERLEQTVAECRAAGAQAAGECVDVADRAAVERWMRAADAAAPLDRVFSNAGVSTGEETDENVRATFATNVSGNMNVVLCAVDLFRRRKERARRPQILITSSIAGYAPLPACPSYSATKACMKTWALALRGALRREGISVCAICPGFVRSRITERNTCPMPFFMEAPEAARRILRGADRDKGLIAFPWPMRLAAWFLSVLPQSVAGFAGRLLPEKVSRR